MNLSEGRRPMAGSLAGVWLRRRRPVAGPAVSGALAELEELVSTGDDRITTVTSPYHPADATRGQLELLRRFRVLSVRDEEGAARHWQILVLNALDGEVKLVWGPADAGDPGRRAFLADAVELARANPARVLFLGAAFAEVFHMLNKVQRPPVEAVLRELQVVASLDPTRRSGDEYRFPIPGMPRFELRVREDGPAEADVRLVDRRPPARRRQEQGKYLAARRVRFAAGAEDQIRGLDADMQVIFDRWFEAVARPEATREELGLGEDQVRLTEEQLAWMPTLRAVLDLGPAYASGLGGVAQTGRMQAVAVLTPKGGEIHVGVSNETMVFWAYVVHTMQQKRFESGLPGLGHYAPGFRTSRQRRWGLCSLLALQAAAGSLEASNAGEIVGLIHRLTITVLGLAVAALCIPLGQKLSANLAMRLFARGVGTRALVAIGTACYAGLWLAGLARPGPLAFLEVAGGWALFGLSNGFPDTAIGLIADGMNQGSRRGQFGALGFAVFTAASIVGSAVTILTLDHHVPMVPHMVYVWVFAVLITAAVAGGPNLKREPTREDLAPTSDAGKRSIRALMLTSAVALGPLGAVYAFSGPVEHALGASATLAALAPFLFLLAGGAVQLAAWLARRTRPRWAAKFAAIGALAGAAAIAVAAFDPGLGRSARVYLALLAFAAVGAGLQLPPAIIPEVIGKTARKYGSDPSMAQIRLVNANYMALGTGQALQGGLAGVIALLGLSVSVALPGASVLMFGGAGVIIALAARNVPRR
jgi:hypothetical protein